MAGKILLVDDEPRVLAALKRGLGQRFSLSCASSGAEALSILDSQGPFAALVTDMRMPGMSGLELLHEARRRVRRLPASKVKIDRMFIQDIVGDPAASRIVEAIVGLAGDLRLTVIAEGVETTAQRDANRKTE